MKKYLTNIQKNVAKPLIINIFQGRSTHMKNNIKQTKANLLKVINEMGATPSYFVTNPETDFSRKRKLGFEDCIKFLLSMEGSTVTKEIYKYFPISKETITNSGFNQQRSKILPEAFEYLFKRFTSTFDKPDLFEGYRLLACDGSGLNISRDSDTNEKPTVTFEGYRHYNQLHLDALYDLKNNIYLDAVIQGGKNYSETRAMVDMIDRSNISEKVIITADRGYSSFNISEHIERKGWNYVIRTKDICSNGITASIAHEKDEFDIDFNTVLTTKSAYYKKHIKGFRRADKRYFDFCDEMTQSFYPINMRIVRFKLSDTSYECLITNLSRKKFPVSKLKKIYFMRWGIETSFRKLKYTIGLVNFHSKKVQNIKQEVFARLIMYNFCERIISGIIIKKIRKTQYEYQLNFTVAIHLCREYFKGRRIKSLPVLEELLQKHLLPIRPERKEPRKLRRQSVVSFIYRIS